MANLIPPAAKRGVQIEYWVRVSSVWLALFGTAALAIAALNVPIYILVNSQSNTYAGLQSKAEEQDTSFVKIEADIKWANNAAVLLASAKELVPLGDYIKVIDSYQTDKVVIDSYDLTRSDAGAVDSIKISGTAIDRESLVALSTALESDERFSSAEIPLSNLAKDSNIPFTINVVANSNTP